MDQVYAWLGISPDEVAASSAEYRPISEFPVEEIDNYLYERLPSSTSTQIEELPFFSAEYRPSELKQLYQKRFNAFVSSLFQEVQQFLASEEHREELRLDKQIRQIRPGRINEEGFIEYRPLEEVPHDLIEQVTWIMKLAERLMDNTSCSSHKRDIAKNVCEDLNESTLVNYPYWQARFSSHLYLALHDSLNTLKTTFYSDMMNLRTSELHHHRQKALKLAAILSLIDPMEPVFCAMNGNPSHMGFALENQLSEFDLDEERRIDEVNAKLHDLLLIMKCSDQLISEPLPPLTEKELLELDQLIRNWASKLTQKEWFPSCEELEHIIKFFTRYQEKGNRLDTLRRIIRHPKCQDALREMYADELLSEIEFACEQIERDGIDDGEGFIYQGSHASAPLEPACSSSSSS